MPCGYWRLLCAKALLNVIVKSSSRLVWRAFDRVRMINICAVQKNARLWGEIGGIASWDEINTTLRLASRESFDDYETWGFPVIRSL